MPRENNQPMQTSRRWFAAVNCDGMIYAISGQARDDDSTTPKIVEKVDSATNLWKYVTDTNIERFSHAACILQKVDIVGGITKIIMM